jgi:hypothetical protein
VDWLLWQVNVLMHVPPQSETDIEEINAQITAMELAERRGELREQQGAAVDPPPRQSQQNHQLRLMW